MSYINEALKKAQKEKDALFLKYSGILSSRRKDREVFKSRVLWGSLALLSAILLAFGAYSWLNTPKERVAASGMKSNDRDQPSRTVTSQARTQGNQSTASPSMEKAQDQGAAKTVGPERPAEASQPETTGDAQTLYERAELFRQQGRLKDARRFYEETLKLDPRHVDALNNLGVVYLQEKDYSAAQRQFEAIIRIEPEDADPFYNLACLHAVKGEQRQGLAYLKKAISLNPLVRTWARTDSDLDNLRSNPEFEEIIRAH
ncbi:MAG: tetratricopeptide repeat protein [Deltaproteobacteria bacterium]|nr:tetratricopeptide repeat protein [Deltaproteobacteria bacterium]